MWGVETRGWNDVEDRHRMAGAIFAYPMFENALRHHAGRTVAEQGAVIGDLFARFAAVAAQNPLADRRDGFTAEQIAVECQGLGRIGGTEMDMVKPKRVWIFHHLDAGAPRVENEPHLKEAGYVAQRGSIWKTLHSDP